MNLRVLVINGQDSFRGFLSDLLYSEGHTASCVPDFREASRAAAAQKPDLIILEFSRPEIGTLEIVQRLQRSGDTRQTPIIVISECADLEYELLNVFDFIAKPVDLARLREDLKTVGEGHKKRALTLGMEPFTSNDYQLFYDYLITHSGLHFERHNLKILQRALASRMAALMIGSYRDYFDYLTRHSENRQELQKLLPFLTIGETYFFRYHAHFDALRNWIATELATSEKKRIRLWSAGCSTGEEAYSIAMTVMEALPDWRRRDIRILATDINNRSLKKARDGVYGPWAMRVIENDYVDRYFHRIGKSYMVREEVKSLVDFSHLNLQTDAFPTANGEVKELDAIFCRNVMIYFSLPTTRKIVDKLAESLVPGGLLFLGHAETLSRVSARFERQSEGSCFYYREKKVRALPLQQPPPVPAPMATPSKERKSMKLPAPVPKAVPPQVPPGPDVNDLFRKARALFDAEKYNEASALVAEVLRQRPRHTGGLVIQGLLLANNGSFDEA